MSGNGKLSAEKDDLYTSVLGGSADVPDDKVIDAIFAERSTKHAHDAIDYEDIDELAEEDEPLPASGDHQSPGAVFSDPSREALSAQEEHGLQAAADNEFDTLFGGDDGADGMGDEFASHEPGGNSHTGIDILHDVGNNKGFEDDGLDDLGLGFEDLHGEHLDQAAPQSQDQRSPAKKRRSTEYISAKTAKLRKVVMELESKSRARVVRKYFPTFSPDKPFNFHKMVLPDPMYYSYMRPPMALKSHLKPLVPLKVTLEVEPDQRKAFRSKKTIPGAEDHPQNISLVTQKDLDLIENLHSSSSSLQKVKFLSFVSQDGVEHDKFADFSKDLVLATADWDDDSIISAGSSDCEQKVGSRGFRADNFDDEESFSYNDESIFDGQIAPEKIELNMNNPKLLFEPEVKKSEAVKSKAQIPTDNKLLQQKFNVSNERAYSIFENNYNAKVRSQLSNLNIEHSIPALRLQTPYYKIKLSKEEARNFHRPKFQVIQGSLLCFSKLKTRKKKKDRGKSSQEIFSKTSDLTVADSANLIAMEYSEENPSILSNFGMGSKIINYYRKEREDDNTRPKAPIGETHVLGVEDRSPFWNFGHVAKGDFVPTLYNNMVRAPVFKQEPKSTDFLLLRSQGCGNHQRFYLRRIDHLFAVGNTFPAVEVPAPHSRKVTHISKNRLKMIVFRTMNKNGMARLSVKDISSHFPDQNDMQNRQRLKEFMEYQRQGDDQGYWKIRGVDTVPTEQEIKAMVNPEDAALLDCMQHGQQVLDDLDSLYNDDTRKLDFRKDKKDNENDDNEAEEKRDAERKKKDKDADLDETMDEGLAPWSASRNFIISNQTKSMLQLNGEGDPTGIGLGFSFLRATQKHGFRPLIPPPKESVPKHTTASYQQKLYENEISRIWYGQRRSLTVDDSAGHSLNDIYREYKPVDHVEYIKSRIEKEKEDKVKASGDKANKQNVLRITRLVRDENDIVQRKVEYIHDPRLIKAYIKRRKQIEGDKMSMANVNEIIPTNDAEMNKIRRKALEEKIANLQKRAKLSKGRKPTKDALHLAAAAGGTIIDANTVMLPDGSIAFGGKGIGKGKSTTRRCKSCGAFGHIRTNKACPLYNATRGGTIQISQEQKDILLASVKETPGGDSAGGSGSTTPAMQNSIAGGPVQE